METISVDSIKDNSDTDFDLYIVVGDQLTLYAKAPYSWSRAELSRLLEQGHTVFYYFISDQSKVEAFKAIHQIGEINRTSEPLKRIVNLTDVAAELTRVLYDHPLSSAAVSKGEDVAEAMVDCVMEDMACVRAIGHLANHDYYTYYHSARVSAYALAIAMHLSQKDEAQLRELAIGCLFHDVGKSKIDLSVLNKPGALDRKEWEMMKQHPVFGDELISGSLLSAVPRNIVLHHHERFDGTGYPHNLTERELLEEVKIAAFSDIFDALTSNRPYQVSRSRFQALDFIKHQMMGAVHRDSFRAMVEILGLDNELLPKKTSS